MPDVRLAIVGDGPSRRELEKHFHGTPTCFAGYLRGEPLATAYASSDLFILPSKTETLGLVLMEAMAAGCPVVACNAGGVPDAVENGVTGFLFEPGDPRGLVNAVRHALDHPEERDAIRTRARADVERRSWQDSTEQLRRYYAQAIADPRPKSVHDRPVRRSMTKRTMLAVARKLLP
jgi:glycosyltransferase involved in cell wall biosynthesis